jgi:hypothetical protein
MKFIAIFFGVTLLGIMLLVYAFNFMSLINWDKVDEHYHVDKNTTQSYLEGELELVYESGLILDYLNVRALVIFIVGMYITVLGAITFIHTGIDKLFMKKFYQEPELKVAIRRGALWGAYLPIILLFLLFNFDTAGLLIMITLVFVFIEVIASFLMGKEVKEPKAPDIENATEKNSRTVL